jgi:DNA-directed RNA polymerase subunit M/transcription elongation factor TFIIS
MNMIINNPTTFRKNMRSKLCPIIDNEKITTNLEIGVYNYAIKEATSRKILKKWDNNLFVEIYTSRFRSIYMNLKKDYLKDLLENREVTPEQLSKMTHYEMDPTRWKTLIDKKHAIEANKFNQKLKATTDMFTCKKCKSKRCTHYELQTRSADEPATIFVTCLDCGKNWRS